MKESGFSRLYGLVGILCAIYFIFEEITKSNYRPSSPFFPSSPFSFSYFKSSNYFLASSHSSTLESSHHRQLINQKDTCTSKSCSSLFFLSGIYDIVNFDIRFTSPFEEQEAKTLFEKASFSEFARSKVKDFSSFQFFLYSNLKNSKNTITGSYAAEELVNGSAIIVVSEYPGREMWFHSDALLTATCLNGTNSLIVFANALNSEITLFTKTPDGNCEKIEMNDEDSSPLTYCQARNGFVWEIFTDWKCSTQRIAFDSINGGLGTVYGVVIGNNLSTADLVTVSHHSSFEGVRPIKEDEKSYPSFFQRHMILLVVGSVGAGCLLLLLLFYLVTLSRNPTVVGFREGDVVVYELTQYQIKILYHDSKKSNNNKTKTKGFALIIRAPPTGFFAKLSSEWILGRLLDPKGLPKFVLQLQPLKKVVRTEVENSVIANGVGNQAENSASNSIELTPDNDEAPISINKWGLRGGRVLVIISVKNIQRRCLSLEDPSQKSQALSIKFSQNQNSDESNETNETEILTWMENEETECLLTKKREDSPLRQRKPSAPKPLGDLQLEEAAHEDEAEAEANEKKGSSTKEFLFWQRILKYFSSFRAKSHTLSHEDEEFHDLLGAGWLFSTSGEFDLKDGSSTSSILLQPHLKKSSQHFETTYLEPPTVENSTNPTKTTCYTYLLTNLPSHLAGEKISHIYCREWHYPPTKNNQQLKREKSKRQRSTTSRATAATPPGSTSQTQDQNSSSLTQNDSSNRPQSASKKPIKKASSQTEEILNVLIKEHESSPMRNSNIESPDISQFVNSPQPLSVRIAMRRELSRKNRILLPSLDSSSPPPVFTAPRLMSTPLPVVRPDRMNANAEEISTPTSLTQSYFVTPPRADSMKSRKPVRQISADLYSQTNKKSKKQQPLYSPNSSPQLNQGNSVNSSATTIPTSPMFVNADREVNIGFGKSDRVRAGSKLEIDDIEDEKDDDNDDDHHSHGKNQKKKTSDGVVPITIKTQKSGDMTTRQSVEIKNNENHLNSQKQSLPTPQSPRQLSRPNSSTLRPSNSSTFTASPKTLSLKNSPRKAISARKIGESQKQIQTVEWEDDDNDNEQEEEQTNHQKQKPRITQRVSSRFDMDLNFLPDEVDD